MSIANILPTYIGPNVVKTNKGNEYRKSNSWLTFVPIGVALDYGCDKFFKGKGEKVVESARKSNVWKKMGISALTWGLFGFASDIFINMYRAHLADKDAALTPSTPKK